MEIGVIVAAAGAGTRLGRGAKAPVRDESQPHDHHRDFDSRREWNGEVYVATAPATAPGPERAAMASTFKAEDRVLHLRREPATEVHAVDVPVGVA